MSQKVLIVQKSLPQYRRRFFELLRERLTANGVSLVLVHGQPEAAEASRQDVVALEWAVERRTIFVPLGQHRLYWQPCLSLVPGADLVIVEQAGKLLVNYVLVMAQLAGVTRLAFWGHGRTAAAEPPSRLVEAAKAAMSRRAHWWFAYNDLSARYVKELGFPPERITAVQNAIDAQALTIAGAAVSEDELAALRVRLRLKGRHVGLFVGAMYREKRLRFLIAACQLIKERMPDFEMIFVGSGPDRAMVEEAVAKHDWMRYVGPLFDNDKVTYFRLAHLVLMPGRVGLGILDSFALGTPTVTTRVAYHSPEIDYLEDEENGVVVQEADSPSAYAKAVEALLTDAARLSRLRVGCLQAANHYTVENMADRFADGIGLALQQ